MRFAPGPPVVRPPPSSSPAFSTSPRYLGPTWSVSFQFRGRAGLSPSTRPLHMLFPQSRTPFPPHSLSSLLLSLELGHTKHSAKGPAEARHLQAGAGRCGGKRSGLSIRCLGFHRALRLWGMFPTLSGPQCPHLSNAWSSVVPTRACGPVVFL